jgi:hypothetical protein
MATQSKSDQNYGKAMGSAAFARGVMCAPAMDAELRTGPMNVDIFKGWQRGWIAASLAA